MRDFFYVPPGTGAAPAPAQQEAAPSAAPAAQSDPYAASAGPQFDVAVDTLFEALRGAERSGVNAVSPQGARGKMQVMPNTFKQYALPGESYDNEAHRDAVARRKIADDLKYFGGDASKVAAAYIGGRGAIRSDGAIRDDVKDAHGTTPKAYAAQVVRLLGKASAQPQQRPAPSQVGAPPAWSDVLELPEMRSLSQEELEAARNQYFVDVVAPLVPTDQLSAARTAFDQDTKPGFMTSAVRRMSEAVSGLKDIVSASPLSLSGETLDQLERSYRGLMRGVNSVGVTVHKQALDTFDRIDRGERVSDLEDPLGYRLMDAAGRARLREQATKRLGSSAASVTEQSKSLDKLYHNPAAQASIQAANEGRWADAWAAFKADPGGVIKDLSVSNLAQTVPMAVGGVAGALMKGIPGMMVGIASGSFPVDYAMSIPDYLADAGVDLADAKAVDAKLSEPGVLQKVQRYAATHAATVAAVDAATGRVMTPLKPGMGVRRAAQAGVGNVGKGVTGEMVGEALGQAAGRGDVKMGDVIAEGLGAGPQTAAMTAASTIAAAREGAEPAAVAAPGTVAAEAVGEAIFGVGEGVATIPTAPTGTNTYESSAVPQAARAGVKADAPIAASEPLGVPQAATPADASGGGGIGKLDTGPLRIEPFLASTPATQAPSEAGAAPSKSDASEAPQTAVASILDDPGAEPAAPSADLATSASVAKAATGESEPPTAASNATEPEAAAVASPMPPVARPDDAAAGASPETPREAASALQPTSPIDEAAHEAASSPLNQRPEPTPAQIEANNAKLGHIELTAARRRISVENPAGSIREDKKNDPPRWRVKMTDHYGYLPDTIAYDSTPKRWQGLDAFVKKGTPANWNGPVFVINQSKPDGSFDEHKTMHGWDNAQEAREAYLANYDDRARAEKRIMSVVPMDSAAFDAWAYDKTKKGPRGGALKPPTAFEDEGTSTKAPYVSFEAPAEIASALRELPPTPDGATSTSTPTIEAEKKDATTPQQRAKERSNGLLKLLGELGGVSTQHTLDITGEKSAMKFGGLAARTFRKAGRGIDEIATALHERGYISDAEYADVDGGVQRARAIIRAAVHGDLEPITERQAQREYEALADENALVEQIGDQWGNMTEDEKDAELDEIFGSDTAQANQGASAEGASGDEAAGEGAAGSEASAEARADEAEPDHGGKQPDAESGARQPLELSGQTPEEVRAEEARRLAAEAATTVAKEVGKQIADAIRDSFSLSAPAGSITPNPTSEPRNQRDLLASPQPNTAATPKDASEQSDPADAEDVQTSTPQAPQASATTARTVAEASLTDVGEELWYNRRNALGKGLKWEDVEQLNPALKAREVVKSKVWPRPDYEQLITDGLQPLTAYLVKQVYDSIAVKPSTISQAPTDAEMKAYIETLSRTRDTVFEWARDNNAQRGMAEKMMAELQKGYSWAADSTLVQRIFPLAEGQEVRRRYTGNPQYNKAAMLLGGSKFTRALSIDTSDVNRAVKAISDGWPAPQEAWRKQYEIQEWKAGEKLYRNKQTQTLAATEYAVVTRAGRFKRIVADGFATREAAEARAKELATRDRTGGDEEELLPLSSLRREGVDRRAPDEDITPQNLKDTFGFRGVNFGNWTNQAERQAYVNHAYDALLDLAELMDVPPKAISLNGMLGLAFGAQGRGGHAAAHFVPGVNEINLTKTKGTGALAHEWAHALDHHFAVQAGEAHAKREEPFITHFVESGTFKSDSVRPEVVSAFRNIVKAMRGLQESPAEIAARVEAAAVDDKKRLERWLAVFEQNLTNNTREAVKPKVLAEFRDMAERIRKGELGEGTVMLGKGRMAAGIPQVVAQVRNLYKDAIGHVPNLDDVKGLARAAETIAFQKSAEGQAIRHRPQTRKSEFLKKAEKLDEAKGGQRYWSIETELFARSFQTYVLDRLRARAARNDYLTRPQAEAGAFAEATKKRYPQGDERTAINEAFDTLVATIETAQTDRGVTVRSSAGVAGMGMKRADVKAVIDVFRSTLKGLPNVHALPSLKDAPAALVKDIKALGGEFDTAGAWHDGEVYLFADQLSSPEHAAWVLLHEATHHGLRGMFGRALDSTLMDLYLVNKDLRAAVARLQTTNRRLSTVRATEEVLANMGADGMPQSLWQRLIAGVRKVLRSLGFSLQVTDSDIRDLVAQALRHVKSPPKMTHYTSGTVASGTTRPIWRSAMAEFIAEKAPNAAPTKEWGKLLEGWARQGKFKQDELAWSGVAEWLDLQQGKVSKDAVLDFLNANGVQVQEVMLDDSGIGEGASATRYSKWTLPGGENYRELLLTLPKRGRAAIESMSRKQLASWYEEAVGYDPTQDDPGITTEALREKVRRYDEQYGSPYAPAVTNAFRSSHWDQPNVIAHVRFNERTDVEGQRVLFIEELQSDWAQKGRREGFGGEQPTMHEVRVGDLPQQERVAFAGETRVWESRGADGRRLYIARDRDVAESAGRAYLRAGVPSAPFVEKTEAWVGLALKRMIRYAADNGFDRVAFVTGEQSAERYDLSKQVKTLSAVDRGDETYDLIVMDQNDQRHDGGGLTPDKLRETVGKELAEKITAQPPRKWHNYTGLDLKVGGEGMKSFYDKIVPGVARDVLKKLGGGRLDVVNIEAGASDRWGVYDATDDENQGLLKTFDDQRQAEQWAEEQDGGVEVRKIPKYGTQPGFDITPELREHAMQGMTMLSRAATGTGTASMPGGYRVRATKVIDTLDAWLEPIGRLPEKQKYLTQRYAALGKIARVDEIAAGIRKALRTASPEDKQAIYDYLTTRDATPDAVSDATVRGEAVRVKTEINAVGDALVRYGVLSPDAHEQYRDAYLPRLYLKHLLSERDWTALGAGKKPSTMGYLKHRQDIPEEVRRVILGEITEPGFLGAVAVAKPLRDLALLDWLSKIAGESEWVLQKALVPWGEVNLLKPAATPDMFGGGGRKRRVSAYWLRDEAARLHKQAAYYEPELAELARTEAARMDAAADAALGALDIDHKAYRQIPDTPRYGRLRGIWVRKEIYDDLMGVNDFIPTDPGWFQQLFGYGGVGTKITQLWKTGKVALNPPSQVRNFISNGVLLQLSGVSLPMVPVRVVQAWREIAHDGPHWKVAKKYGVTESTFSAQELYRAKRDLLDLERDMGNLSPLGQLRHVGARIMDFAGDLYQKMEALFKTAKIIDEMAKGTSADKAALEAQKWLFDYSLVAKEVRYARNAPIGAPFLTFQVKVLPRLIEVALKHPQRFLPWAGFLYGMMYAVAAMYDVDDEDLEKLKKALPEWLQDRGHAMLLPIKDDRGRWQVVDLGYFFPWTAWTELAENIVGGEAGKALKTAGVFSGPITDMLVAIKTGKDSFTDRDIWKPGDPPQRQALAMLNYMWGMAMPPFLTDMGFAGHMTRALTGETNRYGDPLSTEAQAAMRLFGMNVYAMEPEKTRSANIRSMSFEVNEVRQAANQRLQDRSLTPQKRAEVEAEYKNEAKRRGDKLRKYISESGIHPNLATQR